MSLKLDANTSATAYHVKDGAQVFPYAIDAHSAVARFPKEWSMTPWSDNGEQSAPIVEIPDGWQDLKPLQRINIAVQLGADRKGLTAAKADEVIEAEAEARAEAPAPTVVPSGPKLVDPPKPQA